MQEPQGGLEERVYVEILGIPADCCPPDYYTLLGLDSDVTDAAVIDAAARKRADTLRRGLPAELQLAGRRILKTMTRARVCLLDANARAAYNAKIDKGNAAVRSVGAGLAKHKDPSPSVGPSAAQSRTGSSAKSGKTVGEDSLFDELELEEPSAIERPLRGMAVAPGSAAAAPRAHTRERGFEAVRPGKGSVKKSQHLAVYSTLAVALLSVLGIVALIVHLKGSDPSSVVVAGPEQKRSTGQTAGALSATAMNAAPPAADDSVADEETSHAEIETTTSEREQRRIDAGGTVAAASRGEPRPTRNILSNVEETRIASLAPADGLSKRADRRSFYATTHSARPLEELLLEVSLPPVRPVDTDVSASESPDRSVALGPIASDLAEELEFSLDEPQTRRFQRATFYVTAAADSSDTPTWEVHLAAETKAATKSDLDKVGKGFDEVIARLFLSGGNLRFAWADPKYASVAEQLRNCVLCVKAGSEDRRIPLRRPQDVGALELDLTEANQTITMTEGSLPSADAMSLHVQNVRLPYCDHELIPDGGIVKHGEEVHIRLLGWKGTAEIRVGFAGSEDEPRITITKRYKLDSHRWRPLTEENVANALRGLEQALERNTASLEEARGRARTLPSQISAAEARAAKAKAMEKAALINEIIRLKRRLRAAESTARRMLRSIPEIKAKIPLMRELERLIDGINKKGSIDFCIFVPTNGGEYDLLRTRSDH